MALLGLHRRAGGAVLQRRLESMPGERRAFDARRIGFDTFERREAFEIILQRLIDGWHLATGYLGVKRLEQLLGLGERLAFQHLSHQRGRCRRDRAAAALEAYIFDLVALDLEKH